MKKKKSEKKRTDTVFSIIRQVRWPGFIPAVKLAVCAVVASAAISGVLYLYAYVINQAVAILS